MLKGSGCDTKEWGKMIFDMAFIRENLTTEAQRYGMHKRSLLHT